MINKIRPMNTFPAKRPNAIVRSSPNLTARAVAGRIGKYLVAANAEARGIIKPLDRVASSVATHADRTPQAAGPPAGKP